MGQRERLLCPAGNPTAVIRAAIRSRASASLPPHTPSCFTSEESIGLGGVLKTQHEDDVHTGRGFPFGYPFLPA